MNPSYNGVGTQAPQNNSQMPGQAGPVGSVGSTGSVGSVGQPIVSSGAGDVVLPGGGPEKKSRRGVVALIVLVVLVALAGGGFLLWQNGVFGGRNSETAQQTESLEAAYNSYVNYVLWGVESDGRPDLMAMVEATPYFENLEESQTETYLAEVNVKYFELKRAYEAGGTNVEVDVSILKKYFEDYAKTWWTNEVEDDASELLLSDSSEDAMNSYYEIGNEDLLVGIDAMGVLDKLYVGLYGDPEADSEVSEEAE